MIKRPPKLEGQKLFPLLELLSKSPAEAQRYSLFQVPTDKKGRYFPFDEFIRRLDSDTDATLAWAFTKLARRLIAKPLLSLGAPPLVSSYIPTATIEITRTLVDQSTTTAALEWANRKIGEEQNLTYMLEDLIEDEAISSSQLEGAATTTIVAREMIKRRREPRSMDERMILGNFKMMRFMLESRALPLSLDLIYEIHAVGVSGIDDEKYLPGVMRTSDNVVVEDRDGNIVHQPPPADGLAVRLAAICEWVNADHDEMDGQNYLHPLIKAICIHFAIGYEHPFNDGNGRLARALFYWFLFKKDYGAFRYISISNLLKEAATQYGKSYLYTETDEMDMTYFIEHQCSIIMRAVNAFKMYCQKSATDIEAFNKWMFNSGVYGKLSEKQRIVFQIAKSNPNTAFTARYVEERLSCAYNTAASVLNGLVDLNLFEKQKDGKEWIYSLRDKQEIQKSWVN
jgi:Fic family protein